MTASPCHRLDAMKSFERVLGRVTKVIQGSCDGWKHLVGIRTKCKWQMSPGHWLWSQYHVAFYFLPATQLGLFSFPRSWFSLVESEEQLVLPQYCEGCWWLSPGCRDISNDFSEKISAVCPMQLKGQKAATWQLVCVSPPNQCLNSCLLLPGLRNCRRHGIGQIPRRQPPEEWVSLSGVPCWRQSSTVKDFFGENILLLS